MENIKVIDERVSDTNPIAVAKENIKVSIETTKPETFSVWQNEKVEEVVLDIIQPPQIQTLKDLDADISDLEIGLVNAQAVVELMTKQLADRQSLKVEIEAVVQPAFDANTLAISKLPVEPVEEVSIKKP